MDFSRAIASDSCLQPDLQLLWLDIDFCRNAVQEVEDLIFRFRQILEVQQ